MGCVRGLLDHPGATAFVAHGAAAPDVAGFVIGQIAADEAEILTLGVGKDSQRHGIGRKLVEGLIRAAQQAEARRVFLEVAADNIAALRLYRSSASRSRRSQGLLPAGRRAASEDAVTLAGSLDYKGRGSADCAPQRSWPASWR